VVTPPATYAVEIVYLGEDTSKDTTRALRRVIEHMLREIRPTLSLSRVEFKPSAPDERLALRANDWEGATDKATNHTKTLCNSIATRLLTSLETGVPCFVLFHYDGDEVWSARRESERSKRFARLIRVGVQRVLENRAAGRTVHRKGFKPPPPRAAFTAEHVGLFLSRLVEIVPFYCLETWLYHNFRVAKARCQERCGRHVSTIESWERGEPPLDEVDKPKEKLCFQDHCNFDLAGAGFPAAELYYAQTSFFAAVEDVCACPGLVEALEQTEQG
jgi:hypothetical protein